LLGYQVNSNLKIVGGLYHGRLQYGSQPQTGDTVIKEMELITYDLKTPVISSFAITEYHILVLLEDVVHIYMKPPGLTKGDQILISSLKCIYQNQFENAKGFVVDQFKQNNITLYTDTKIYLVLINDESREIWKMYLEKAIQVKSEEYFNKALKLTEGESPESKKYYDLVLCSKADYYFKNKKYNEAADIYSMTTKSFEQICVQFYNINQKDSLRRYLLNILKRLKPSKENNNSTQLSCLSTWLTELFLEKLNQLSINEKDDKEELLEFRETFRKFLG
jgi:vacuolar protein sorting-associated protein 18